MMNGWDMNGWGWAGMVTMLTIGILLVALLALTFSRSASQGSRPEAPDDPIQILARRLARGEIDEDEYQRRKKILQSGNGSPAP